MTEDGERGADSIPKTQQGCSLTGMLLCTDTEGSTVVFATGCSSLDWPVDFDFGCLFGVL